MKLLAPQRTARPRRTKLCRRQPKRPLRHTELPLRQPEFHLPKMKLLHRLMKTVQGDIENAEQSLRTKENRPSGGTKRDLVT
jgi:hypothetical protein